MALELAAGLVATEADRLLQAEALVRGFCGWHIAPSRAAETYTTTTYGGRTVFLPSLYVTAVASVTDDLTSLVVDDEFSWSQAGVLTRVGYWGRETEVVVTFTHGYAAAPPDVTAVVQAIAQRAVQNPGSLIRTQDGPFSDTFSTTGAGQVGTLALLESEKEILRRYRIPVMA